MALHMNKKDTMRNIKVTMNETVLGVERRSSTTLSYVICDYYFGVVMYPEQAAKVKNDKRFKDTDAHYRQWLENQVKKWAKTQPQARSMLLERTMLEGIHDKAFRDGIRANKDNHGLDV